MTRIFNNFTDFFKNNREDIVIPTLFACEDRLFLSPLDEIRLGTGNELDDVKNLATRIVDPDNNGTEGADALWQKTERSLLMSVILHVLYKAKNGDIPAASLRVVASLLAEEEQGNAGLWSDMKNYPHYDGKAHPIVARMATHMVGLVGTREMGSLLESATFHVFYYCDAVVEKYRLNHSVEA